MIATERREPRELVAEVERLLDEIETLPDSVARDKATGLVQALVELYGAGLERMVDEIAARDADAEIARAFAADELISHLMLLHGLHPVALEDRVLEALGEVRPYLESHGGNVELVAVEETAVHLRLQGSCSGCPSSTMTLKLAIENAIHKAAPEIEQVIAEEEGAVSPDAPALLQIELAPGLASAPSAAMPGLASASRPGATDDGPAGSWLMAGALPELSGGGLLVKSIGGQPILFLALGGHFYGYRPQCPACEGSLAQANLHGAKLICRGCGSRFDALRAGRCLDEPQLHLEPVPLLVGEDGLVKVALAVGV